MTGVSQGVADIGSLISSAGDLFGGTVGQSGTTKGTVATAGSQTKQLVLDDAAIQKLIEDVLGGAGGLAEIFAGEQSAGVFNSSVAAEAAGDLASKLVGELAKLTGQETITQDSTVTTDTTTTAETEDEGILSGIGDFFGF